MRLSTVTRSRWIFAASSLPDWMVSETAVRACSSTPVRAVAVGSNDSDAVDLALPVRYPAAWDTPARIRPVAERAGEPPTRRCPPRPT